MNKIRLETMLAIRATHTDEYYKKAAESKGVDPSTMTHAQISAWKAALDCIEADAIIQAAEELPVTNMNDIEMPDKLLKP